MLGIRGVEVTVTETSLTVLLRAWRPANVSPNLVAVDTSYSEQIITLAPFSCDFIFQMQIFTSNNHNGPGCIDCVSQVRYHSEIWQS